ALSVLHGLETAEAHALRVSAYVSMSRHDMAKDELVTLQTTHPDTPEALLCEAHLALACGDGAGALAPISELRGIGGESIRLCVLEASAHLLQMDTLGDRSLEEATTLIDRGYSMAGGARDADLLSLRLTLLCRLGEDRARIARAQQELRAVAPQHPLAMEDC
ncbi:coatomer, epsilon subunit, partial [Kipferlia bialata]